MGIRVGVLAPSPADAEQGIAALRAIEAAGLDHVVVGDHVSFISGIGDDGLVRATTALARSSTLEAEVGVYLLPLRHPIPVARQLATIDQMAPGRLVLGVGVGGEDPHELEVCGVDPSTRGRRCNEALTVLRGLQNGNTITHRGRFFDLTDASIRPGFEGVRIVVGGRSDAAVRRAGRFGDGWLGIWVSPARFASVVEQCAAHAARAGRTDVDLRHGMQVWCGFAQDRDVARALLADRMQAFYRLPFERFEKYSPAGTASDVAEFLSGYVDAGCRSFNLLTVALDEAEQIETAAEVKRLLDRA